jgi:acetyltransferase EpsM
MSKKIIIIGGKGNGSVIANAIIDANRKGYEEWRFSGFLNDRTSPGELIEGSPVLGKLADCSKFISEGYFFLYTIYRIDGQRERIRLYEKLSIPESQLATFIHPDTYISPDCRLCPGCALLPGTMISAGVLIGKATLFMAGSFVGHNSIVGDHCHLAARCCLGSEVVLEKGVHIGLNASIRENVTLGKYSTLGMGSVLLNNVDPGEIWAGNPAKFIRKAE